MNIIFFHKRPSQICLFKIKPSVKSVSQNLVEKTAKLTLLPGEVKLCVVGERLGQVELDVLVGEQGVISFSFLFQLKLCNFCFIVFSLFLNLIVNERNILCSLLLYNPLLDCDLQNCFLSLSVCNSLYQLCLFLYLLCLLLLCCHQLFRPLHLHLLVVFCDIRRNIRLWDNQIQNFNAILSHSFDTLLYIFSNIGDNLQEHRVVNLVNCVVCTENPQILLYSVKNQRLLEINSKLLGHEDKLVPLHHCDHIDLIECVPDSILCDRWNWIHLISLRSNLHLRVIIDKWPHEMHSRFRHSIL